VALDVRLERRAELSADAGAHEQYDQHHEEADDPEEAGEERVVDP
jgi:hypothetical protein